MQGCVDGGKKIFSFPVASLNYILVILKGEILEIFWQTPILCKLIDGCMLGELTVLVFSFD
jgi:hypothetical protein